MARTRTAVSRPPRARRRRRVLLVSLATLGVVVAGAVWGVGRYGPRFGVYLVPPSPQQYADVALDLMAGGLTAQGPQWEGARDAVRETAATAPDHAALHGVIADAVRAAGGSHSFLLTPEEVDAQRSPTGAATPAVRTDGGITTVTVPEAVDGSGEQQYADTLADGIEAAAPSTCGWVVDLRGNTGGSMYPMLSGLTALLPEGPALSFRDRDGRTTGQVTIQSDGAGLAGRTAVQVGHRARVTGPVAVLQDGGTASSGEVVLLAFRGLDHVATFGEPSAGYASANTSYRLYDGAVLVVTEALDVDRDGAAPGEAPIPAGTAVPASDAPAAAAAWLAAQGCAARG